MTVLKYLLKMFCSLWALLPFCQHAMSQKPNPIQSRRYLEVEFSIPYDGIKRISFWKDSAGVWMKNSEIIKADGERFSTTKRCYQCAQRIEADLSEDLKLLKDHQDFKVPCIRYEYFELERGEEIGVKQLRPFSEMQVKVVIHFDTISKTVRQSDPFEAFKFCPYEKERMRMLLLVQSVLTLN
jgi:hypothetical protein